LTSPTTTGISKIFIFIAYVNRILQESLIALKTILKEIDPFAFEESLRMSATQKKIYAVR
jgi:hypothetical protein